MIITIPKSGTNLVERVFGLSNYYRRRIIPTLNETNIVDIKRFNAIIGDLTYGRYLTSHLHYSEDYLKVIKTNQVKTVFMMRDPRDIAVSMTHYIYKTKKHNDHYYYKNIPNFDERLVLTIIGNQENSIKPFSYHLANFTDWLIKADIIIKYEDFFNEDSKLNSNFVESLINEFNFPDKNYLDILNEKLVSASSPTFRKGIVGDWVNNFNEKNYNLFLNNCGKYLDIYGYKE